MVHRRSVLALAAPLLGGAAEEDARAALSRAQVLLFETPHLASLRPPVRLDYDFRREEDGKEPVADSIRLEVRASPGQDDKRDVTPEFLTGPRALRYPPAPGFVGNPLLVFALDREVRELGAATGGTPNWFRNRFRRALATAAEVSAIDIEFEGRRFPANAVALTPYAGEPRAGRYQERRYVFTLAEALPGWFHSILAVLPPAAGNRDGVVERITFAGTAPLPEGAG
ncbi:MAG: hypothetical protein ICV73_00690 [Acetobacteraceae bacterium]|nr:hypothetical protein [Acetobacteraceae bacterium]